MDTWNVASQITNTLLVLFNLVIFFLQFRLMGHQLQAQRDGVSESVNAMTAQMQRQTALEIIKMLEEPRNLQARAAMRSLAGKPHADWTAEEVQSADIVARIWTIAADLWMVGALPNLYLHYAYGNTVVRHWNVLRPYIEDLRDRTGASQRKSFEDLANDVIRLGWYRDGGDFRPAYRV
ncbi:DUF4760 domain-containing protein [Streptomyces sp. CA-135486]|uniref:DUF4760 domain-containing protein n=1 Tax=Streptomyces sp. CA-135486 TaxID=3240049 RepID=UPI003D901AF0